MSKMCVSVRVFAPTDLKKNVDSHADEEKIRSILTMVEQNTQTQTSKRKRVKQQLKQRITL